LILALVCLRWFALYYSLIYLGEGTHLKIFKEYILGKSYTEEYLFRRLETVKIAIRFVIL